MESDDLSLRQGYSIMQREKTVKMGKTLAYWGIPVITLIGLIEWLIYRNYGFVICRLLFIITLIAFLLCSNTVFKKHCNYVIPFHIASISSGLLMMAGLVILKFESGLFTPAYLLSSVTGGFVVAIFTAFLFSAGARKYLKIILPLSLFIPLIYTLSIEEISWQEITFFVNPTLTILGVIIIAEYQEKLVYSEYKQRVLAERKEQLLQREIEERKILEKRLFDKTIKDELTGAYNRRMLSSYVNDQIIAAKMKDEVFTLCYLDIDNLKLFNDLYGHREGDILIRKFYNILKRTTRDTDVIFRVGGDEFIVIFPNCWQEQAETIINRTKKEVKAIVLKDAVSISFSLGFSEYKPDSAVSSNELIDEADKAMYKMKRSARDAS